MEIPKGYKQSEVGVIPQDWDVMPLGDILEFKNGLNKGKEYFGYGDPIINYIDVYHNNGIKFSDVKGKVFLSTDEIRRFQVRAGDVFFTRTSETPEEVGFAAVLLEDIPNCSFSGFVLRGRPKCDFLSKEYCVYCFQTKHFRNEVINSCTYTTRALTNGRVLSKIYIPVPPVNEQKAIAMALSNIDELIAGLGEQIEKKRQIKDGAMQQLLTGKTRLPGFNGDWMKVSLGEIGTFVSGGGFPLQYQGNLDEELPFYKVSDFNNSGNEKYMIVANNYVSRQTAKFLGCKIIPAKSIVFAKIGAALMLERKRITSTDCCIDNNMMSFQPNDNLDVEFLHGILLRLSLSDFAEVTALPSLKQSSLQKIVIHIPQTKEEQSAIAQILSDMDDEIRQLEAERDKYAFIKQGMMQELLTGKTRLV